jgi:hypothetical protein
MGSQVLGSALVWPAVFLWGRVAFAQPAPEPIQLEESPPAGQAAGPSTSAEPPPLDPPPPADAPAKRPAFLHTREEMQEIAPEAKLPPAPPPVHRPMGAPDPGFVARSSPWIDMSLTSFYMNDRVDNFLNLGVQVGGYLFEHLRVSGRLVAPLEQVRDSRGGDFATPPIGFGNFRFEEDVPSRAASLLYGGSVGLVISNDRSFVFGPSLAFMRSDVEDYGTAVMVALPFEWTTAKNLRIGFELALGQATGGTRRAVCVQSNNNGTAERCGMVEREREGGAAVFFQYYMGWSLGRL